MRVYIAQLLCPSRHCVMGAAGEYESDEHAKILGQALEAQIAEWVAQGKVNHECALCKSKNLHVEVAPTRFATIDEATPRLIEMEIAQQFTREYILGKHRNN